MSKVGDGGGQGRRLGPVTRAVSAALTLLGVPKTAANRLARPVLVSFLAAAGLIAMVLFSAISALLGGIDQDSKLSAATLHPATPEEGAGTLALPGNVLEAYKEATKGTRVPWTVLAAIGEVTSGNGTGLSPFLHGPRALSNPSGWPKPASGGLYVLGDGSLPPQGMNRLLGTEQLSEEVVVSLPADLEDLPAVVHSLDAPPGSVLALSLGPALAGLDQVSFRDMVTRTVAAVPASITVVWLTADLPDWREVPVIECDSSSPYVPELSTGEPRERSRESDYPWHPDYVPPGPAPVEPGCRQTGTRMELASEANLAEDLNTTLKAVALEWSHLAVADTSAIVAAGLRPGPKGTYSEDLAKGGGEAQAGRMGLVGAEIKSLRAMFSEVPEGRCPQVYPTTASGGVGIFGIQEEALAELGVSLEGRDLADICDASEIMVEVIGVALSDQAESQGGTLRSVLLNVSIGARSGAEQKAELDLFWEQVISRIIPTISTPLDPCLLSFESESSYSPREAISSMWRCVVETRSTPQWDILEPEAGGRLIPILLSPQEAARRAVEDALEVSQRHSGMQSCNLFPLDDEKFTLNAPEGYTDRCDPMVEAYAAAVAFHNAASTYSASPAEAPWEASSIGWNAFSSVEGAGTSRESFLRSGPERLRVYPISCVDHARQSLISRSSALSGLFSVLELQSLARFESLGSAVVEASMREPLISALAEVYEDVSSGPCADAKVFDGEERMLIAFSSVILEDVSTPEEMLDRAPDRLDQARRGDIVYYLGELAGVLYSRPSDMSTEAPLLQRISYNPLPAVQRYSVGVVPLPSGKMLSQIMVGLSSQYPGAYAGLAWGLSGQGLVPEYIPFSAEFNSYHGRVDPRLLLAIARSSGPLDPAAGCEGQGPYGLFALSSRAPGCGSASDQVSYVADKLEELAYSAEGSMQGAVYAFMLSDESLAASFVEADFDIEKFAENTETDLLLLGAGPSGRSFLSFWYESQMTFAGDYTQATASSVNCSTAPMTYTGGFLIPTALPVPVPSSGAAFGMRWHPIDKDSEGKPLWKLHAGVDWGMPEGTPIHSTAPGTVVAVRNGSGYGYLVEVLHAGGFSSRYAHLARGSAVVYPGQQVAGGEVLACSGNTGKSTGPHLHFEIRLNGTPLDPCARGACTR